MNFIILNKKTYILFFVLISILSLKSRAQSTTDWGSWNTIEIGYKLNKDWNFSLEQQLRLKENISEVDKYFTQLNSEYRIHKNFRLGLGLRYISEHDNKGDVQGYDNYFRFNIDATYKHDINDFKLGYRLRYQNKNELGVSYEEGDFPNQNIRFKTSVGYDIKDWTLDPKFSAEIFNRFQEGKENGFNKYRLTFGTDFKIKNYEKFGMYYRFEKELNVDFPDTTNIVGLKYSYTFK